MTTGRRKNERLAEHVRTACRKQDHRREHMADRRTHEGVTRILFIDVVDLWTRFILRRTA
jgi:hypothetical protein